MLTVGSMFAGIGGIDLGLERTGRFRTAWFAEIDPFASAVLRKHWPDVPNFGDVRDIGEGTPRVDLIAGGFPCQPVSLAGKRLAQEDPRWLWPHVARAVGHLRPRAVLLENVPGLRSKGLGDVLQDLSALGYDAEWDGIPASAVSAPHRRDRVWIVAYPNGERFAERGISERQGRQDLSDAPRSGWSRAGSPEQSGEREHTRTTLADTTSVGRNGSGTAMEAPLVFTRQPDGAGSSLGGAEWLPEPSVGRVVAGLPNRMAQLRALGNAVVPQVAEVVGYLIADAIDAGRI